MSSPEDTTNQEIQHRLPEAETQFIGETAVEGRSNEYDHLFNPGPEGEVDIVAAAVGSRKRQESDVVIRTRQQMGIDAADRNNREAAGLPPRP